MNTRILRLLPGLFVLLALVANVPTFACTQAPQQPPIIVDLHEVCMPLDDPTHCMIRAWITILDYSTFESAGGEFCGCGLKEVGKIKEILRAELVDENGDRLAAFTFDPDADTTQAVTDIANGPAAGFLAELSEDVEAGTTADLMFEVLLEGGWTMPEEVVNSIVFSPNPAIITGEFVPATGEFDPDHLSVYPPGNGGCGGPGVICKCMKRGKWKVFLNDAETVLFQRSGDTRVLSGLVNCSESIGTLPQPIGPTDTTM